MKTLNLIGAGSVATTLARLWHEKNLLIIQDVYALSYPEKQTSFIGQGKPCLAEEAISYADIYLIAVSDDAIAAVVKKITESELDLSGTIIFHVSGAKSSALLAPLKEQGASCASVHPVMTFSDYTCSVKQFPGCYCTFEGDIEACQVLLPLFEQIGANPLQISSKQKPLYHAAIVMAHNHLCALMTSSLSMLKEVGLSEHEGLKVLQPIVASGVENIFLNSPKAALTGPIMRGDVETVKLHLNAINDKLNHETYITLAKQLIRLSPTFQDRFSEILEK